MSDELAGRVRNEAVACLTAHKVDVVRATTLAEKRSKLVNYHSIGSIRRVGSSSWQSVLRGTGNVETDYLNGEIAQLGRRYDIATPVNELLQRRANEMARRGLAPGTVSITELHQELADESERGTLRIGDAGLSVIDVGSTKVHHCDLSSAPRNFTHVQGGRHDLRGVTCCLG